MATDIGDIDGIGPSTIEKLEDNEIKSIDDLANADVEDITTSGISNTKAKEFIHEANKSTVTIQSTGDVEQEYKNKKTITTGIKELDNTIEGGWQEEAVVSIYGDSSTGKTQLCMQALVEGVRQTGEDAIYIETEKDRYRPERIQNLMEAYENMDYDRDKDKIHRVKAYDLDRQFNAYSAVIDQFNKASMVVVDSLVAQFRLSDKFGDRSTLGKRGQLMGKHLKKIQEMATYLECPALFTNQIYEVPDSNPYGGDQKRQYGGKKVQYVAQFSIMMEESHGDLFSCNVEAHPSQGDAEVIISINKDGIESTD